MLNRRVNILFTEEQWKKLRELAKRRETSAGDLVRKAVRHVYLNDRDNSTAQAIQKIKTIRKRVKDINYREYINYGKKY